MKQSQRKDGENYYTVGDIRAMLEGKRDGMPILIKKTSFVSDKPYNAVKGTEIGEVKVWCEEANEILPADCLIINSI